MDNLIVLKGNWYFPDRIIVNGNTRVAEFSEEEGKEIVKDLDLKPIGTTELNKLKGKKITKQQKETAERTLNIYEYITIQSESGIVYGIRIENTDEGGGGGSSNNPTPVPDKPLGVLELELSE